MQILRTFFFVFSLGIQLAVGFHSAFLHANTNPIGPGALADWHGVANNNTVISQYDQYRKGLSEHGEQVLSDRFTIPLKNYLNMQYSMVIGMGSPPQFFDMLVDTGSEDIWVPVVGCSGCRQFPFYDPRLSSSDNQVKEAKEIVFGDGTTIKGFVAFETIACPFEEGMAELIHQYILEVYEMSRGSLMFPTGIVGLSHKSGDVGEPHRSFLGNIFSQYPHLPRKLSTFLTLAEDRDLSSTIILGSENNTLYAKENPKYAIHLNSDKKHQWMVELRKIGFQDPSRAHKSESETVNVAGGGALVDTGTSMIVFDNVIYRRLIQVLVTRKLCEPPDAFGFTQPSCRCPGSPSWFSSSTPAFPDLVFEFTGEAGSAFTFSLNAEQYVMPIRRGWRTVCELAFQAGGERMTASAILGMPFFRSAFVVFDYETNRIGFARSRALTAFAASGSPRIYPAVVTGASCLTLPCIIIFIALLIGHQKGR